jgi:hypothetical protein
MKEDCFKENELLLIAAMLNAKSLLRARPYFEAQPAKEELKRSALIFSLHIPIHSTYYLLIAPTLHIPIRIRYCLLVTPTLPIVAINVNILSKGPIKVEP